MTSPVISISNLTKTYSSKTVLNNLNWQIETGDVVALLGKNGAGKSTLLESIMNLREIDAGEIGLWGYPWAELPQTRRQKIAFVAQETIGFEWMRVTDFLTYLGGFFPTWDATYCKQLQNRWELDPKQRVGDLSGGQTQIMHVIQALSTKPEFLVLDEPVAHLDPNMRRQFLGELIELSLEHQSTVVFSSHIVSDLERVANKVALLQHGAIQHFHEIDNLKSHIAYVKISGDEPLKQTTEFKGLVNWKTQSSGATATIVTPLDNSIETIGKQLNVHIETTPISLEDWYLEVSHAAN